MTQWCNSGISKTVTNQTKNQQMGKDKKKKNGSAINKIGTNEAIWRINIFKSWFIEKINQVDKFFAWLMKRKNQETQINIMLNE